MNIFCYFTISHVASVRVIRRNYALGERNNIRVKKSSSLTVFELSSMIMRSLLGKPFWE